MSKVEKAWPQNLGFQQLLAQVKRRNAEQESTVVAFESPLLTFLCLCGHGLKPRVRRLYFDIHFHGYGLQVRAPFRDVRQPDNKTSNGLDSFKVLDLLVEGVLKDTGQGLRGFSGLHGQAVDVQVRSEEHSSCVGSKK